MSKLFKFIENAIFEEDAQSQESTQKTETAVPQPVVQQNVQTAQPVTVQTNSAQIQSGPYVGQIRKHFAELICSTVADANIPGPDFSEIKEAFESDEMKQNIPDTNTRWKTCFSMMKMMNKSLTKQHVLESIDVYVGVVDNEKKNAMKQIEQKENETVNEKYLSVTDAENSIQRDEDEIKKLQEKINKIMEKISGEKTFIETTKQEIATAAAEIERDKADLEVTAETIKQSLISDKATLESVLPND
jgi:DNA repair exonuclease SbcCD ATPase subunit